MATENKVKQTNSKIPPQVNVEVDVAFEKEEKTEEYIPTSLPENNNFHNDGMFGDIWDSPYSRNMW